MTTPRDPDTWELTDYASALRRRWWVVVGCACVGLAIAAAAIKLAPKTYTATASVSVNALPTDTRVLPGGTVDMDTEAQLATSPAVATAAAKQLPFAASPGGLANDVTVTVPPNTTLLQISCQLSKSGRASECANAFASAYLTVRRTDAITMLQGQLTALKSKADALLPQIAQLHSSTHGLSGSSSGAIARRLQVRAADGELNAVLGRINYVSSQLAGLEGPNDTVAGNQVTSARPPKSASSPKKSLFLPSGLAAGLIIGLILAFWLALRDKRLHGPRDVERASGASVLLDLTGERAILEDPPVSGSRQVAAFAQVAEYVASAATRDSYVVLVAGATPDAGTSIVAANLAAALSELRPDVFLVAAAQGAPGAPRLLGVDSRRGLAQVLDGGGALDKVARRPSEFLDLRVIGPGTVHSATGPRQNYDARRDLMAELRSQARYAIVESPLGSGTSTAFALAEFADAAIVVVEASHTTRSELDAWLRHLARVRVPVLGAVLVPWLSRRRHGLFTGRRAAAREPVTASAAPAQAAAVSEQQSDTGTALLR
jgi:Mrp family chromosome partitioning ATPase/capsular polysaccharide biosynthesis protein